MNSGKIKDVNKHKVISQFYGYNSSINKYNNELILVEKLGFNSINDLINWIFSQANKYNHYYDLSLPSPYPDLFCKLSRKLFFYYKKEFLLELEKYLKTIDKNNSNRWNFCEFDFFPNSYSNAKCIILENEFKNGFLKKNDLNNIFILNGTKLEKSINEIVSFYNKLADLSKGDLNFGYKERIPFTGPEYTLWNMIFKKLKENNVKIAIEALINNYNKFNNKYSIDQLILYFCCRISSSSYYGSYPNYTFFYGSQMSRKNSLSTFFLSKENIQFTDWILNNCNIIYVPFGTTNYNSNSIKEYISNYKNDKKITDYVNNKIRKKDAIISLQVTEKKKLLSKSKKIHDKINIINNKIDIQIKRNERYKELKKLTGMTSLDRIKHIIKSNKALMFYPSIFYDDLEQMIKNLNKNELKILKDKFRYITKKSYLKKYISLFR